jgi:hypothetical protein
MQFFGAPALRRDQFAQTIPQSYMSVHLTISAPLGSYDSNSEVNTGANRWSFHLLVNLDITPDKGVSWIDLYAAGRFFTNNNAFQGTSQLSQKSVGYSRHFTVTTLACDGMQESELVLKNDEDAICRVDVVYWTPSASKKAWFHIEGREQHTDASLRLIEVNLRAPVVGMSCGKSL